jgi:hypothetical protein
MDHITPELINFFLFLLFIFVCLLIMAEKVKS